MMINEIPFESQYEREIDGIENECYLKSLNYEKAKAVINYIVEHRAVTRQQVAASVKSSPRTIVRYIRLAMRYEDIYQSRWRGTTYYIFAPNNLYERCRAAHVPVAAFVLHQSLMDRCVEELKVVLEYRASRYKLARVGERYLMGELKRKWVYRFQSEVYPDRPVVDYGKHPTNALVRICQDIAMIEMGQIRPYLRDKGFFNPKPDSQDM